MKFWHDPKIMVTQDLYLVLTVAVLKDGLPQVTAYEDNQVMKVLNSLNRTEDWEGFLPEIPFL